MRIGRKIFLTIIAGLLVFNVFGQDDNKETARQFVEIANQAYFELRVISVANEQYTAAAEMDPENIEANYMAGRTFLEMSNKANATKYLLRVQNLDPNYKFNILYLIGQGYHYAEEFETAIEYYSQYLEKAQKNTRRSGDDFTSIEVVQRKIYECQNGIEYVNAPRDYLIENVGPSINSEWDDFAPVVTANESFMAFTTRRQDGNSNEDVFDDMLWYEDVFYSQKTGGKWQYAQNIGPPINIVYHSSNLAISADGSELYLFKSQDDTGKGDIFLSTKNPDGSWSEPEPLNGNINSTFSENSVSISPDGNTLYFSSDRPITTNKQDLDIYYSKKDRNGEWGTAKNLGSVINTPYDEDGPFIDYDGKTLYFSSKGHKGMGGYDIYKTTYDETTDTWSEPINLGYPMNSPDNDVYFVSTRDGERGYYASAKSDGLGYMDIYHIRLADLEAPPEEVEAKKVEAEDEQPIIEPPIIQKPQPVILVLKTVDKQSQQALEADITVAHPQGGAIPMRRIGNGIYQGSFANESAMAYNITIQKAGYMYKNMSIKIPAMSIEENKIARQISLDKIQTGYSQVIRNIYFDFGTAQLKKASNPELDKLLKVLEENPRYIIEISGHTDNVGGKDFNKWLSERRAQAVVNYMIKHGQSEGRFLIEGYGEEKPLASNDDEEMGRELNRRVEFRVMQFRQ